MQRACRPRRVKQHSTVGILFDEMQVSRVQEKTAVQLKSFAMESPPVRYERKVTTPPPPKAGKIVISFTSRILSEVPDVPFPLQIPTLSPVVHSKDKVLPLVPTLGDLKANEYHLSRAQAA